ncbi:uncharacterized protein LOC114793128 [Denticeps clupeoides]|uniref:uncharacterized protein LOC114793128 n=1 Tax=Denticeps clupeoides TaxID=299321 RepID=UPI0010A3861B|nr:uncharacterized protein LOC114793128 [Denticeps clupeoides]
MRPRSRLLAKRGLPTIREGYEELVHDMNQVNSQHTLSWNPPLSTQDYFLSICQLARPTFPLCEADCDILSMVPLESPKPCLRLQRHRDAPWPLSPTPGSCRSQGVAEGKRNLEGGVRCSEPGAVGSDGGNHATADPLEFLYSNRGAACQPREPWKVDRPARLPACRPRSDSFPRASISPDTQRKSSCPELRLAEPNGNQGPKAAPAPARPSSLTQKAPPNCHSLSGSEGAPSSWKAKGRHGADKNTMVSHWIAECRSAWREARIHACMLPVIAEK